MSAPRKTSRYKAVHHADHAAKLPRHYDKQETPKMKGNMPYKRSSKETDS